MDLLGDFGALWTPGRVIGCREGRRTDVGRLVARIALQRREYFGRGCSSSLPAEITGLKGDRFFAHDRMFFGIVPDLGRDRVGNGFVDDSPSLSTIAVQCPRLVNEDFRVGLAACQPEGRCLCIVDGDKFVDGFRGRTAFATLASSDGRTDNGLSDTLSAGRIQSIGNITGRANSESVLLLFHWACVLDGDGLSYRVVMPLRQGEHRVARSKVLDRMVLRPLPQTGK